MPPAALARGAGCARSERISLSLSLCRLPVRPGPAGGRRKRVDTRVVGWIFFLGNAMKTQTTKSVDNQLLLNPDLPFLPCLLLSHRELTLRCLKPTSSTSSPLPIQNILMPMRTFNLCREQRPTLSQTKIKSTLLLFRRCGIRMEREKSRFLR